MTGPTVSLSNAALTRLPAPVAVPGYDRASLRAGIVHFGVGNFHRAHQAFYLDRLFGNGLAHDWAIIGAGVMPADARLRGQLATQDWLSLHVARSATKSEARVIGSMVDFLPVGDGAAIVDRLTDPALRIVSLTVTEGGYFLNGDGEFDARHPAVMVDAATPDDPATVFGLMIGALRRRRDAGLAPFTVMSCDNLPHNGRLTRRTTMGLARLIDPALADWIADHVAFPNGMVDRITPATSDRERAIARESFGIEDAHPVFSEDFIQWVLEDDFPQGRPPLEQVGVTFVKDVTPYEEMKLRILNASHAMIAYPAALLGIDYAHDAVTHPLIAAMLDRIQREEVLPGVTPVPEMRPDDYFDIIRARFANPAIADTISRLCHDGLGRQPKFIVPVIRHALDNGLPIDGLALSCALWCRYCIGTREDGTAIAPNDSQWVRLMSVALEAKADPAAWLAMEDVYGAIGQHPRLKVAFSDSLQRIWQGGVRAAAAHYIKD